MAIEETCLVFVSIAVEEREVLGLCLIGDSHGGEAILCELQVFL